MRGNELCCLGGTRGSRLLLSFSPRPTQPLPIPLLAPAAEDLLTQLEELGIPRDAPHPVFGRTPELLKLFCTRR